MLLAALFDYDGTLVDSDAAHYACWNQALRPFGFGIDESFYAVNCVGALSIQIARQIGHRYRLLPLSAQALADEKDALYEQWIGVNILPLRPGVEELLEFLAQANIATGIVTGAPLAGIQKTLHDHGIDGYFKLAISREAVARGKPAPDGYLVALRRLNVAGSAAVSFEDTRIGVLAAKAAGMRSFAIPSAFTAGQDFSAADHVCSDMVAARRLLQMELT